MRILVGDIGGTNTRFAVYDQGQLSSLQTFLNTDVPCFDSLVERLVAAHPDCVAVSMGIAGPVVEQRVRMMNFNWTICGASLTESVGIPVRIFNDFHAQAFAVPYLADDAWVALDEIPQPERKNIAVIGAGTGLGEAMCIWTGDDWFPVAGEGSHVRFGPKDQRQIEVLTALLERWPEHVSVERIVSGPGIATVYDILKGQRAPHRDVILSDDPSAAISRLALEKSCEIAMETIDMFVDVLADEAASLALKCAAGSVYISGGIPPKILPIIEMRFRNAFHRKGRYRDYMTGVPIRVVTEPHLGLLGAGIAGLSSVTQ
ncbi:MAG: glucokinase [Bradymonadia bacterium]